MKRLLRVCAVTSMILTAGCWDKAPENFYKDGAMSPAALQPRASPGQYIAIQHRFELKVPSGQVETVQRRDIAECARIKGAVLNSNLSRNDYGVVNATLSLRVPPESFSSFVETLASPPAEIIGHSQNSEDKTVAVLDTGKRLEAKIAVRDRLQELLKNSSKATPGDIATIAKEIGDVQGEIESLTATQDYLKTIIGTIQVNINYEGTTQSSTGINFLPIIRAVHDTGQTFVGSVAAFISFIIAIVPWLPFAALVIWGIRKIQLRWKRKTG